MQTARHAFARLVGAQGLWHGNLQHHELFALQRTLRDTVTALDERRVRRGRGGLDAGSLVHEAANRHGIDARVRALVDYLEHVIGTDARQRDLQATRTPAAADGHLAAGERHLVSGNGDGLQDGAANLALGALVQKGKVIVALHENRPPSVPRRDS